jgi:hypothetical protein
MADRFLAPDPITEKARAQRTIEYYWEAASIEFMAFNLGVVGSIPTGITNNFDKL